MKVVFYLRYHTKPGESLWLRRYNTPLIGNSEEGLLSMYYLNNDFWKLECEVDASSTTQGQLQYQYIFKGADGTLTSEYQEWRSLDLANDEAVLKIYDVWNYGGEVANVFSSTPFKEVLLQNHKKKAEKQKKPITHTFKIKAPLLRKDEVVCMLGDKGILHNWDTRQPVFLNYNGEDWSVGLNMQGVEFPLAYKYGIYNKKKKEFAGYEGNGNRMCFEPAKQNECVICNDGFIELPSHTWKGAGIAIPVFSLRSNNGFGVGEFNDLKLLADWAEKTGLKLIQILPVNDTSATLTWKDSYPYAAISAFALHPIYINIATVAGKTHKSIADGLKRKHKQLKELDTVDYEQVLQFKLSALRELFDITGATVLETKGYKDFYEANKEWLKPYAAYCYLRDKYKTPDPSKWKSNNTYVKTDVDRYFHATSAGLQEVQFYCYLQYQLHLQLREAVIYAHEKGIVIKGDIPIGVYRYGCDAWVAPGLFKMNLQAGAPPDDFAVNGQNWGFPTYNWSQMQADDFAWWRLRFEQMSRYFDAFRIDHILGFFRIWSIPVSSVQGIMGSFDPCLPVHVNEFGEKGIWFDYERFCRPFINDEILQHIFGQHAEDVKAQFLQKNGPRQYALLPEYNTQRKIEAYFKNQKDNEHCVNLINGLYALVSNIILFEHEGSGKTQFHFRISMDKTTSFQGLPPQIKEKLWNIYIDYFFRRQDEFWRKESLKKLPGLKAATNMLVCGEDLGMVPGCVPDVMKQLGILSLEIQRMPKQTGIEFFNPANAPYLSVVTPSTHDMSTIRGWWQENREATQRFYNNELGQNGEAPYYCEAWINRAIILQHLYSPAMWSIFQLQDILGMSDTLRREKPEDERINVPANPEHYWRYRMHISLEQLIKEKAFNKELKEYVENSGRGN